MKKKTINKIRNISIVIAVILAVIFVFKEDIYRFAVQYKEDGNRKNYKTKDKNLTIFIEDNIPNNQEKDIEALIDLSQEIASKALSFSDQAKENDPNKTVLLRRANSTGYASFTATTGNYLINKYKLNEVWEARPVKAKLFLLGNDMHKKTKNDTFKDHDFVIFRNKITKKEICVDPILNDRFGINRISKQE